MYSFKNAIFAQQGGASVSVFYWQKCYMSLNINVMLFFPPLLQLTIFVHVLTCGVYLAKQLDSYCKIHKIGFWATRLLE